MAFFQGSIRSGELSMDTMLSVVLPWDKPAERQQNPCKVVYLLHGLSNNATGWIRHSMVERYATQRGIAVVMPEVQRGFYSDMHYGLKYFSYVANELPKLCEQFFGFSAAKEHNYIAGLSMGGYGALKCALTYPEKYAGCASFSGVLDIHYIVKEPINNQTVNELTGLLGPDMKPRDCDDLFKLAENAAKQGKALPRTLVTCGRQDYLYETNVDFRKCMDRLGLAYDYREWDGGHDWDFWDKSIEMALDFFSIE